MGSPRLDRGELRLRLSTDHPCWVTDELADAFEPAFLAFRRQAEAAAKKRKTKPEAAPRRTRMGRSAATPPDGESS